MFVRISKARYAAGLHAEVTARLSASSEILLPVIESLPGCLSFYAGSDQTSGTMVNISAWDTLEHAQAMDSLPEMAALAKDFITLGVEFERPNVNYPVLWHLPRT